MTWRNFLVKTEKSKPIKELLIVLFFGLAVFILSAHYDILEKAVAYSASHEDWNLDEVLITLSALFVAFFLFSFRRWQESVASESLLRERNHGLETALTEIRRLRGILPICASCKKIRDDSGYWHQVEAYLLEHSEVEFSHSICPDCSQKLYPDFFPEGGPAADGAVLG
jgi:hypothetical protein